MQMGSQLRNKKKAGNGRIKTEKDDKHLEGTKYIHQTENFKKCYISHCNIRL